MPGPYVVAGLLQGWSLIGVVYTYSHIHCSAHTVHTYSYIHCSAHTVINVHPVQDDELEQAVTGLLKGADLLTVTNNSVCKQVFEKFPGVDLTTKKDFIKSCIQKTVASSS